MEVHRKELYGGEEALFYYDIKQNKVSLINEKQTSNAEKEPCIVR